MNRAVQRPGGQDRGVTENSSMEGNSILKLTPRSIQRIEPLQVGYPGLTALTSIPRRSLEMLIASGKFPQPTMRIGRRPYWATSVVREWVQAGGNHG
jgi:predicted DNA-binding transcriptional regulator AlpA